MKRLIGILAALALLFSISGCSCSGKDPAATPDPAATQPTQTVRPATAAPMNTAATAAETPTAPPEGPEAGELPAQDKDINSTPAPTPTSTPEPENVETAAPTNTPTPTPKPFWGGGELELPPQVGWDGGSVNP